MTLLLRAALMAVAIAGPLFPTAARAAPGWSASLTIESFIASDNLIIIVSGNDNLLGCSTPSWMVLKATDPNFALISSTVLTAFSQKKSIKVWQSACETSGQVHFIAAWVDR